MTKLLRWWGVLMLGIAFGTPAMAQTGVQTGTAFVTGISGQVLVRVGKEAPRPLQSGRRLPPGAVVATSADAYAVLTFADGQIVVLDERSMFRIARYEFDPKDLARSAVSLNLIEGSARLVLGAIGRSDPGRIRIQVGTGIPAGVANPGSGAAANAGVVLQGDTSMVSVTQGRATLTLPGGRTILLASGQSLYVQPNGAIQQGSFDEILSQISQTPGGRQIVSQMESMQSFTLPQRLQQTVITLASPQSVLGPELALVAAGIDALEPPGAIELATTTPITAPTGGGGGGTPCGASCN